MLLDNSNNNRDLCIIKRENYTYDILTNSDKLKKDRKLHTCPDVMKKGGCSKFAFQHSILEILKSPSMTNMIHVVYDDRA